jgi:type IV secretory pathway VirB9-like protein
MKTPQLLAALILAPALLLGSLVYAEEPVGETVTIRNDGDNTYYEFRVNGQISEIKVVPKVGPAYYLVPSQQEDGDFVRKDNPNMRVPKWVIFRW